MVAEWSGVAGLHVAAPARLLERLGSKSDRAACSCRGRITRKSAAPHAMAPVHQDKPRIRMISSSCARPSYLGPFRTHLYAGRNISCHLGLARPCTVLVPVTLAHPRRSLLFTVTWSRRSLREACVVSVTLQGKLHPHPQPTRIL